MNAYRYLDYLLAPRRGSLHRALLKRLVPVWLLLSLLFGSLAYWIETVRIDRAVLALSTAAVQQLERSTPSAMPDRSALLSQSRLDGLLRQSDFAGIRLFGPDRTPLAESWQHGQHPLALQQSAFPPPGQHSRQVLRDTDRWYVQTVMPLLDDNRRPYGYFAAFYPVPADTAAAFATRIWDILFGVLLVVALTTLALYPVIIALNRDADRLTHNLRASNIDLLRVLGSAIAKRDSDTDRHNYRVTLYALALARRLGLTEREILALMAGAFLHDVGKIGISDTILLKPGRLTAEEFALMKTHVALGLEIIGEVRWLALARDVVGGHHERYDGSGYPQGLAGEAIPFNARLFAIVDVFDALTSARPYKTPMPLDQALALMRAERGSHFDPALLDTFIELAPLLYQRYHQADSPRLKRLLADATLRYTRQPKEKPGQAAGLH